MAKINGTKTSEIKPDLALNEKQQNEIVKVLQVTLADESVLYTRLRNYHWNVSGPQFFALHAAFEKQYNEIADLIDETAELIRQYGAKAHGTMTEFTREARLTEEPNVYPAARTMVGNLVNDHEAIIRCLRDDIQKVEDSTGDVASVDFLTGLMQAHQRLAWMLRMVLED